MNIYQLKEKVKKWKKYKKRMEQGETFYRDELVLAGVEDIAENEQYYLKLLRKAEQAANKIIANGGIP